MWSGWWNSWGSAEKPGQHPTIGVQFSECMAVKNTPRREEYMSKVLSAELRIKEENGHGAKPQPILRGPALMTVVMQVPPPTPRRALTGEEKEQSDALFIEITEGLDQSSFTEEQLLMPFGGWKTKQFDFAKMDLDGNGTVNREEFTMYMEKHAASMREEVGPWMMLVCSTIDRNKKLLKSKNQRGSRVDW